MHFLDAGASRLQAQGTRHSVPRADLHRRHLVADDIAKPRNGSPGVTRDGTAARGSSRNRRSVTTAGGVVHKWQSIDSRAPCEGTHVLQGSRQTPELPTLPPATDPCHQGREEWGRIVEREEREAPALCHGRQPLHGSEAARSSQRAKGAEVVAKVNPTRGDGRSRIRQRPSNRVVIGKQRHIQTGLGYQLLAGARPRVDLDEDEASVPCVPSILDRRRSFSVSARSSLPRRSCRQR